MVVFLLVVIGELLLILLAAGKVPLHYNLRNLSIRWKTTLLTALAFTLVIGLLVVMLAFVNGMRRLTEGTGQEGNVLVLAEGATDEAFSNLPVDPLSEIEQQPLVVRENGKPLASRETYMVVNQLIPDAPPGRPNRRFLQVRGIEDPLRAARVHGIELAQGRWFSASGSAEINDPDGDGSVLAIEVVLGQGIAREMGRNRPDAARQSAQDPDRLLPGDTFSVGNRTFTIVGIMEGVGSTFTSEVWAKRSLVAPLFGKENYSSLVLATRDAAAARQFKDFLHTEYKRVALEPYVETDYYASLSQTNEQFLVAIVFITVVMSVGGVFGVMNTMFAAISQRIKDIGVLRLLGYGRLAILISFLLESLMIALVGGLIGCALGSLADGTQATSVVSSHQGGGKFVVLRLVVDGPILGAGLLLSLGMGLVGGLLPAIRAVRLRALDALR